MSALPFSLILTILATSSAMAMSPVTDAELAEASGQAGLTLTLKSPGISATSLGIVDDGNTLAMNTVSWQALDGSSLGTPSGSFNYALNLDTGTAAGLQELRVGLNQAISRQRFQIGVLQLGNGVDAGRATLDVEGSVNLLASLRRNSPYVLSGTLNLTPTNSRFVFRDGDASPNGGASLYYSDLALALNLGRAEFNLVNSGACGTLTSKTGLCITLPASNTNTLSLTIGNLAVLDNSATSAPAAANRAWAGTIDLDIDNAWWLVQGGGYYQTGGESSRCAGCMGLELDAYIKFKSGSGMTFYDGAPGTANVSYGFRQFQGSLAINDATIDITNNSGEADVAKRGIRVIMPDNRTTNDADALRYGSLQIGGNSLGSMQFRNFQSSLEFTVAGHN